MKCFMRKYRKAFSLVEMVAASTVLSMGVVAICTLSARSMSNVQDNRQREAAWDVLDQQLTMIDYLGVEEFLQLGQLSGTVGGEDGLIGQYQWQVQAEEGNIEGLYVISIAVQWGPENSKDTITAITMLNGTPAEYEEDAEAEQDAGGGDMGGGGGAPTGNTGGSAAPTGPGGGR